nr:type II secretion system ATPase GspE [Kordiimonas aquimaris]
MQDISAQEIPKLNYGFARDFGIAVTGVTEAGIVVAIRAGTVPRALTEVRRVVGEIVQIERKNPQEFDALLSDLYTSDGLSIEDEGALDDLDSALEGMPKTADLLANDDDAPVIRLINGLMAEAVKTRASDVHLEPFDNKLSVRLRVDGVLAEVASLSAKLAPYIVSRVKVMARLDIAEKRIPQDGRLSLTLGDREFDVRVSTLPSRHGERVVLRLLDTSQAHLTLSDLGMQSDVHKQLKELLKEPNGIILVTGPTGSGKTTTLYAGLSILNDQSRNIMTVEDPVEYALAGISQTQVNSKVGMTFASGLRAILRQDPDVVMVGEIRDHETAEMAIQASLTGHLVLSTVHTNSAVAAITRLRDMGVEQFLLSSTIKGILAQRLVRKLCDNCKVPVKDPAEYIDKLDISLSNATTIYDAAGCDTCNHTGYTGRRGIYELVVVDDTLRRMIQGGASEQEMQAHAFAKADTLSTSGQRLIADGVTTVSEVLRVSRLKEATGAGI